MTKDYPRVTHGDTRMSKDDPRETHDDPRVTKDDHRVTRDDPRVTMDAHLLFLGHLGMPCPCNITPRVQFWAKGRDREKVIRKIRRMKGMSG